MMHNLPAFEHLEAQSIQQACAILAQHQEQASVIAGGTDLLVRMKYRASEPKILVSLRSVQNLDRIEEKNGTEVVIGALTKLHEIEVSSLIREKFPILSEAAGKVANRLIRNMGTLGGNLCSDARCEYYTHSHLFGLEYWPKCFKRGGNCCHIMKKGDHCYARYSADTATALMALGAKAKIVNVRGERSIPIENFFTGKGHPVNILETNEILTEIQIPKSYSKWKGVYLKYGYRETTDYPIVGIAALADLEGDLCKELRIVAISVASAPVRMKGIEDSLKGVRLSNDVIVGAAEMAVKAVNPIPHHGNLPSYVKKMVGIYTKKALLQLLH
jgi:4-hydroxybenzoyl-CoA reductase beta subunit